MYYMLVLSNEDILYIEYIRLIVIFILNLDKINNISSRLILLI